MTTQQVVFYEDSFQIHMEKEFYDGILIIEKHYDIHGRSIYAFHDDVLCRYYYPTHTDDDAIFYQLLFIGNERKLSKVKYTQSSPNATVYDLDMDTYTHLCTLNNDDVIQYIKNYIKQYILNSHDL